MTDDEFAPPSREEIVQSLRNALRSAQDVTVVLRLGDPTTTPETGWLFDLPGSPDTLEALQLDIATLTIGVNGVPDPFILEAHATDYEWGASHSGWELALEWISGLGEAAIEAAIFSLVVKWAKSLKASLGLEHPSSIDADTAIHLARRSVVKTFYHNSNVAVDDLVVQREMQDHDGVWNIDFAPIQGVRYQAVIKMVDGLPIARAGRALDT